VAVSGGYVVTLAVTTAGKVVVWGDNGYGQCDIPELVVVGGDVVILM
jgi:alpha-tubulin suppressor-like RCC1 family protein